MKRFVTLVIFTMFTLSCVQVASAQQPSAEELKGIREEIKALKEGQATIQKDLQEIKNLLRTRQAQPQTPPQFKEAVLNIDAGNVKGDNNAKLVLIEFSDYQ